MPIWTRRFSILRTHVHQIADCVLRTRAHKATHTHRVDDGLDPNILLQISHSCLGQKPPPQKNVYHFSLPMAWEHSSRRVSRPTASRTATLLCRPINSDDQTRLSGGADEYQMVKRSCHPPMYLAEASLCAIWTSNNTHTQPVRTVWCHKYCVNFIGVPKIVGACIR